MYIEYASINNFRCLENFEIFFKPGMNLIVGGNGAGKTSLMEALACGIAGMVYHLDSPNAFSVSVRDIRSSYKQIGAAAFQKEYQLPVSVDMSAVLGDKTYSWNRSRSSELPRTATGMKTIPNPVWDYETYDDDDDEPEEAVTVEEQPQVKNSIRDWSKAISRDPSAIWPLVAYRRAVGFTVPDKEAKYSVKQIERKSGYRNALKGQIADVYSWMLQMEMKSAAGQEPKEYRLFKKTIAEAMTMMNKDEIETPVISFDMPSMTFIYSDSRKTLALENQSAGYYWILWLLIDLTIRGLILNPEIESISDLEGVVLIDEIDLHLHPKWQWNVLDTLQKIFSGIQFIVTTHAPIVLSSCKDANIIRLDQEHKVDYPGSPYAFSVGDVIEYTQGSYGVLPQLQELYTAFDRAFNSRDMETAREVSQKLSMEYPDTTEAKKAELKLSFLG